MENENQTPHKRRVHYKGKYPKKFEEKYKELQPEKYKDTIAHVIQKGNTPAGMHISIMVKEILDFLQIKPGQTGFDATLGYESHARAAAGAGTHPCDRCRPGRIGKDEKTSGRAGIWRGHADHPSAEFLHDR